MVRLAVMVIELDVAAFPVYASAIWTDDKVVIKTVSRRGEARVGEVDTSVDGEVDVDYVFQCFVDIFDAYHALGVCHFGPFEV